MQYARDFMAEGKFVASVEVALDYLTKKCNPKTGLWGEALPNSPHMLTRQVQAAYQFWLLYAYDCAEPPYIERAVDYVLATQTKLGSYSPVHNKSSACEDIDSVDPLVRYGFSVKQVHDVKKSITRALPWILFNFNRDGGAVFRRDALFEYGHPLMTSHANESSIFATWFRLLSIALIDTINSGNCQQWRFLDAPGYQIHPSAQLSRKRFSSTSSIVTHLTEDEKIFIYNRARMLPKGSQIVEIGSYLGASSCFLAEGGRGRVSKVYCVDTWLNDAMSEGSRDTYTEFLTNTKPYSEIIIPLRGNSVDIGRSFHQTVDLVFLDADHSYEAVSNDLRTWIPKLRPNGWLLLHDYGWAKGVQQAIQEIVIPLQVGEPKTLPNLYAAKVDWQRNNW
jgi:predicted O-methyltransferase YrrM